MINKLFAVLVVVVLCSVVVQAAETDGFEVLVTPSFSYSIVIDSPGAGVDFGSLAADTASVFNTSSVTIRNNGQITADWQVRCHQKTNTVWNLRPRSYQDIDTVAADTATLCMILTPQVTSMAYINASLFSTEDMLEDTNLWYNIVGSTYTGVINNDASCIDDGDDVIVNAERQAYLRIRTPSTSSVSTPQTWQLDIRAVVSSTF